MTDSSEYYINTRTEDELLQLWETKLKASNLSQTSFCKKYGINQANFSNWRIGVKAKTYKKRSPKSVKAIKLFLMDKDIEEEKKRDHVFESPLNILNKYMTFFKKDANIVLIDGDNMGGFVKDIITDPNIYYLVFLRKGLHLRKLTGIENLSNVEIIHTLTTVKDAADHLITIYASKLSTHANIRIISSDYFSNFLVMLLGHNVKALRCSSCINNYTNDFLPCMGFYKKFSPICANTYINDGIHDQFTKLIEELNDMQPIILIIKLNSTEDNFILEINNHQIYLPRQINIVMFAKTYIISFINFNTKIIDDFINTETRLLYSYLF